MPFNFTFALMGDMYVLLAPCNQAIFAYDDDDQSQGGLLPPLKRHRRGIQLSAWNFRIWCCYKVSLDEEAPVVVPHAACVRLHLMPRD